MKKRYLSLLLLGALISPVLAKATTESSVEQSHFEGADDFDADIFDHISDDDLTRMIDIMKKEETWHEWATHKAKGLLAVSTFVYNEYDKELTTAAAGLAILAGCCGKRKTTAFFGALALASFYLIMKKTQSQADPT
jgi:hypothetical protein